MGGGAKKIMFVGRRSPYGTIYGLEMIEALLAGSAFDQQVSVAFVDDGVYQLKSGQMPSELGIKNHSKMLGALPDFDVFNLYVENESLEARGLNPADLIDIRDENGNNLLSVVFTKQLAELMEHQDVIIQL